MAEQVRVAVVQADSRSLGPGRYARPDVLRPQVGPWPNPRIVHSGVTEPWSEPEEIKLVAAEDA